MIKTSSKSNLRTISRVVLFCATLTGILKIQSILLPTGNLISNLIGPALAVVITYLFLKVDRVSFADIGFKIESKTFVKFCMGLITGIALIGGLILLVACISEVQVQPNKQANWVFILLTVLPAIILLAFMEEVGFRGYPLITAKNRLGAWVALGITSVLFGFYHLAFGWGIIGFCSTSCWGLLFGSLTIASNGISMPTGFHSGINLAQLVFGLTGNFFAIWNIKGIQMEHFLHNLQVTFILAPLVLTFFMIRLISKNKTPDRTI